MQAFVNKIFNNEIHLPSAPQLWHIPDMLPLPIPEEEFLLLLPLELQDASYFAESESIFSFSNISKKIISK